MAPPPSHRHAASAAAWPIRAAPRATTVPPRPPIVSRRSCCLYAVSGSSLARDVPPRALAVEAPKVDAPSCADCHGWLVEPDANILGALSRCHCAKRRGGSATRAGATPTSSNRTHIARGRRAIHPRTRSRRRDCSLATRPTRGWPRASDRPTTSVVAPERSRRHAKWWTSRARIGRPSHHRGPLHLGSSLAVSAFSTLGTVSRDSRSPCQPRATPTMTSVSRSSRIVVVCELHRDDAVAVR